MSLTWDFIKQKNFRLNDTNLHPAVREKGWEVVKQAWKKNLYVLITQGYRSIQEQDALYAQGRTKPGNIVTNARGGSSYHNYGLALDFALYTPDGKNVVWDLNTDFNRNGQKDWMEVVKMFKDRGFAWGGDWKSSKDYPHVEMTFGLTINQLKSGVKPPNTNTSNNVIIKYGDSGSSVRVIQIKLNHLGFDAGEADGIFGDKTLSAVKKLQATVGIEVDGIVGPFTLKALDTYQNKEVVVMSDVFKDVPKNHYAVEAIKYCKENKFMIGYPDGTFKPEATVTRAQLAQVIYNIMGERK